MIRLEDFNAIIDELRAAGWSGDVTWAQSLKPPEDAERFAREAIWVICCSGMKFTIARMIEHRVLAALKGGRPVAEAFGHAGKAKAIEDIWRRREALFAGYEAAADKLACLEGLPWIGPITKYHLAKNFGLDVCKPDVHLQRLAAAHDTTPEALCAALAEVTGFRIATIDTILWRACAIGIMDSHTGRMRAAA